MAAPIGICVLRGRELVIELMNEPHRKRFGDGDRIGRSLLEFNIDATNTAMLRRVFETGEPAVGIEVPATADYAGGRQTRVVEIVVGIRDPKVVISELEVLLHPYPDIKLRTNRMQVIAEGVETREQMALIGRKCRPLAHGPGARHRPRCQRQRRVRQSQWRARASRRCRGR